MEMFQNRRIPKLTRKGKDQDEEIWCKSIIESLARRNREKHSTLTEVGEEDQHVLCIDEMSPAKNCRGIAKLVNKNSNTCVTSECMRKLMTVKPLHSTKSLL